MKKALIGGFFSLAGSILLSAVIIITGNNLVSGWETPPGRFWTTVVITEMMPVCLMAISLLTMGTVIMIIELFLKDK